MRDWSLNNLDIGTSNYELIGDIVNCVKTPIQNMLHIPYLNFSIAQLLEISLKAILIALTTGILSSLFSSFMISRQEPYL